MFWQAAEILNCKARRDWGYLQRNPLLTHQACYVLRLRVRRNREAASQSSINTLALAGRCLQAPFLHTPPEFCYQRYISPHVHTQLKLTVIGRRENHLVSFDSFVTPVTSGSLERDNRVTMAYLLPFHKEAKPSYRRHYLDWHRTQPSEQGVW